MRLVFAVLIALASAAHAADHPALPDTPRGKVVSDYLKVFNTGDEKALTEFVNKHWSEANLKRRTPQERTEVFRTVYGDTRGLEFRRVKETTDTLVSILCQAKLDGGWLELGFEFDANPPHGVNALRIMKTDAPEDSAPAERLDEAGLKAALEAQIEKLVQADAFSGAVLVARGDKPIYTRAVGQASRRYAVPNKLDTKFNLGSCNKMFTAVAIAQLVEQGKLAFDDTIGKHLPDYPNADVARKVTLHHLLTHTSGLGDYFEALFAAKWPEIRTIDGFMALGAKNSLEFEPGERMGYSNFGYIVLGAIIEKVSGERYHDYVRKQIFAPAGMTHTDSYEMDDPVPNLAVGYTREGAEGGHAASGSAHRENYFVHSVKGMSAGGGYSTVEDLFKFATALQGHKLLSKELTKRVTTGMVEMGPKMKYAYGFGDRGSGALRSFGHNGGAPGINASFRIYPEAGFTVCVMSNLDPPAAERVADKVEELLRRLDAPETQKTKMD